MKPFYIYHAEDKAYFAKEGEGYADNKESAHIYTYYPESALDIDGYLYEFINIVYLTEKELSDPQRALIRTLRSYLNENSVEEAYRVYAGDIEIFPVIQSHFDRYFKAQNELLTLVELE